MLPETVRIVKVGDYDECLCLGTHVKNTSEVGNLQSHQPRLEWRSQTVENAFQTANKHSHLFPIGYANVAFTPKVLISICLLPIKILPLPVKVQQNLIISFLKGTYMKKIILSIFIMMGLANLSHAQQGYQNPIIPASIRPECLPCWRRLLSGQQQFLLFPGVPLFHSKDLVNWEQIGELPDTGITGKVNQCRHMGRNLRPYHPIQ